jgi:hypothetical protein
MRVLCLALVSLSLLAFSGSKPNFSGVWKLNPAKSDFGKAPAPQALISHIEHHDSEVKVHSEITAAQGAYSTDYKWVTDGRENVNTVRGNEIRATVVWNGQTLISNAKTTVNGAVLTIVDVWALSEDGKTMTISRTVQGPQGAAEQRYVYDKSEENTHTP